MAPVKIFKFGVTSPSDTSPLDQLKAAGYEASQVIGLVGKTEGNGCVNDFSRTLSAAVWEPLLPADAVTVFSGGTEGVLSPHVSFIVREHNDAHTGIVAAVGRTRKLAPEEIGTAEHARQVANTATGLVQRLNTDYGDVGLVLVKCPLLTTAKMAAIRAAGKAPPTLDTYESMGQSRYASAVGVAAAVGELSSDSDFEGVLRANTLWSKIASCSAGAELEDCHILVLAAAPTPGPLRMLSGYMQDAIDAAALLALLEKVKQDKGKVVQVFAKAEADPSGSVRGFRHTMNTDSDIHSTRHARAAVGGLIAGLTGDCRVYVSGGAEGQGPPGGGSLCVVYEHNATDA